MEYGVPHPNEMGVKNTVNALEAPARLYAEIIHERQTTSSEMGAYMNPGAIRVS